MTSSAGVIPLLEGVTEMCRRFIPLSPVLLMSPREILGLELDRHDGSVLDIITLLGASRLEKRRGDFRLHSTGAHRCPRLVFRGDLRAIAGKSKTEVFGVGQDMTLVSSLVKTLYVIYVVVLSMVSLFGLAGGKLLLRSLLTSR